MKNWKLVFLCGSYKLDASIGDCCKEKRTGTDKANMSCTKLYIPRYSLWFCFHSETEYTRTFKILSIEMCLVT